jgi:exonuclease III
MQLWLADLSKAIEEKTEVEEKAKRFEEEKVKIEHSLADIICRQKMKTEEDKLKMKKVKKYARDKENYLHYALAVVASYQGIK